MMLAFDLPFPVTVAGAGGNHSRMHVYTRDYIEVGKRRRRAGASLCGRHEVWVDRGHRSGWFHFAHYEAHGACPICFDVARQAGESVTLAPHEVMDHLKKRMVVVPEDQRLVFLDIDGVLNSEAWVRREQATGGKVLGLMVNHFDAEAVHQLALLCEQLDAKVVISSTWRKSRTLEHLRDMLLRHGLLSEVIAATPIMNTPRGLEIQAWMDSYGVTADRIVILDDDSDMEHLLHRHVKTSFDDGLQPRHVQQALALFKEGR